MLTGPADPSFYGTPRYELLVIVHNLNIVRVPLAPDETQAPSVVDTNTVLPFSVGMQCLQAIPRRRSQVTQFRRAIQLPKLLARNVLDSLKAPATLAVVKAFRLRAQERLDHV